MCAGDVGKSPVIPAHWIFSSNHLSTPEPTDGMYIALQPNLTVGPVVLYDGCHFLF